jgi:hypothetical protein
MADSKDTTSFRPQPVVSFFSFLLIRAAEKAHASCCRKTQLRIPSLNSLAPLVNKPLGKSRPVNNTTFPRQLIKHVSLPP